MKEAGLVNHQQVFDYCSIHPVFQLDWRAFCLNKLEGLHDYNFMRFRQSEENPIATSTCKDIFGVLMLNISHKLFGILFSECF